MNHPLSGAIAFEHDRTCSCTVHFGDLPGSCDLPLGSAQDPGHDVFNAADRGRLIAIVGSHDVVVRKIDCSAAAGANRLFMGFQLRIVHTNLNTNSCSCLSVRG